MYLWRDKSNEEKFMLYSIADGIPQYLVILASYDNLEQGIVENMFMTTGHLYEETSNLLKQELRDPTNYFSIITAIAGGKSKQNEIATTVGLEATSLSKYLKSLIRLGIIEKTLPAGKKMAKKGIYKVSDNYFSFWFRFIAPSKTAIEYGKGIVKEEFPIFQGRIFEKIAADYLMRNEIYKDTLVMEVGTWWGSNKFLKKSEEIDLVCKCNDGSYIIGECKWRNEEIDVDVYEDLRRKSELLGFVERKKYCIFAKNGFSDRLKDRERHDDQLVLICLDDMY